MIVEFTSDLFGNILHAIKNADSNQQLTPNETQYYQQLWRHVYSYLSLRSYALYDVALIGDNSNIAQMSERSWTAIVRAKAAVDSLAAAIEILDRQKQLKKVPSIKQATIQNSEFFRAIESIRNPHEGANQNYIIMDNWFLRLQHCRDKLIHGGYLPYMMSGGSCLVTGSAPPRFEDRTVDSFDVFDFNILTLGLTVYLEEFEKTLVDAVAKHCDWQKGHTCLVEFTDEQTNVYGLPVIHLDNSKFSIDKVN